MKRSMFVFTVLVLLGVLLTGSTAIAQGTVIDFETPSLGGAERQLIDPYVDTATGVTFTAESGSFGDEVVGLVKNSATSACVEPADTDQKLGTGRSQFPPEGSIGLSGFPIRATFPQPLGAPATVSVDFQTGAGVPIRLRLFDASGVEVASTTDKALPADGTCGFPGDPRAKTTLSATATEPVAYAIMDLDTATGGRVFVIDNFTFEAQSTTILQCGGTGTGGDLADLRGIRFSVDQSFSAVEVRMAGRSPGMHVFDAELRRSTGFLGEPAATTEVTAFLPDSTSGTPYQPVQIGFGDISVSGTETFTLKFVEKSAPNSWYFEVFGIGNEPCPNIEETDENDVASPTVRGDPAGFKVLASRASTLTLDSAYAGTPPTIDGIVGFGEWQIANQLPFDHGFITVLNDGIRLYILVDVLDDTTNDTGTSDYFWLTFDVNGDNDITPNVDLNYGLAPGTDNMRYSFYLGPGQLTGLQPNTRSSEAVGFGCFFADSSLTISFNPFSVNCSRHRVWEFGIDLAEIGADAGDTVSMGLRVNSENPDFTDDVPTYFLDDFSQLIQVSLASPPFIIPTPDPSASIGFETDAFEVTQAIQNRANTLPLVADKQTVARMYVDVNGTTSAQPAIVYLYGTKGGADLPGSPLATLLTAPTSIDRTELDDTANFRLPAAWDDAGTVAFSGLVRDLFGNETSSTVANLDFDAREVPVYWVVPINTGSATSPILASDAEIADQQSYLETVYPVPDVKFVRKDWQAIGPTTIGNTINELNDYFDNALIAWVISVLFTGTEPFEFPDQIYGFTPSGGGISDPVWAGRRGYVARGYIGTSREATMAHEINHNLDRSTSGTWGRHAPGCSAAGPDPSWPYANDDIQEAGFDTRLPWVDGSGTRDTVIPDNYPDYMSYCQSDDLPGNPAGQLPTKWLSPYRWQALFNNFSTVSAYRLAERVNSIQTVYYVSGQVNENGTGSLNPILVQPGIPTEDIAPGEYAIEVQDATGTTLLTTPFFVSFINVEGEPVDTVYFNFQLPEQPGAAKILLMHNDQELAEIAVSDNPPTVTVSAPNGGEIWSGTQTIEWEANDPDGDSLYFNILYTPVYTPGVGGSWTPVASRVEGNSYEVDTTHLPAGDAARIRIIATDGFNTAEDDSDGDFTVAESLPDVIISLPADYARFASGKVIFFEGDATDTLIADDSFAWSYGPTVFGSGRDVSAVLPDGIHQITLSVAGDGDDQATDQVIVLVGDLPQIYLPLIIK